MNQCPNCHKPVRKKAKFCSNCGSKIPQDDFDFQDKSEEALALDPELVAEIMKMKDSGDDEYDIELVSNTVDLHISESQLAFGTPILQIQMEIAEKSIDSCIANGFKQIEFITGKGEFILYNKILQLLKEHEQIGQIESTESKIIAHFKTV